MPSKKGVAVSLSPQDFPVAENIKGPRIEKDFDPGGIIPKGNFNPADGEVRIEIAPGKCGLPELCLARFVGRMVENISFFQGKGVDGPVQTVFLRPRPLDREAHVRYESWPAGGNIHYDDVTVRRLFDPGFCADIVMAEGFQRAFHLIRNLLFKPFQPGHIDVSVTNNTGRNIQSCPNVVQLFAFDPGYGDLNGRRRGACGIIEGKKNYRRQDDGTEILPWDSDGLFLHEVTIPGQNDIWRLLKNPLFRGQRFRFKIKIHPGKAQK